MKFYIASFFREKNFYFSDRNLNKYWSYFVENISKNNQYKKKKIKILLDSFDDPNWYISNYLFIDYLKQTKSVDIYTFGLKKNSFEKEIIDRKIRVTKNFLIKPRTNNIYKIKSIFLLLVKKIKTKKDLINFKYKGIDFGIDIYESILREGFETVNLNNKVTYKNYFLFALYYTHFEEIFKKNINYALISHDNYINYNVPAKIARKKGVKLFLIN